MAAGALAAAPRGRSAPPAVRQVLHGSATVVEMMSAVHSARSAASPAPAPPGLLPPPPAPPPTPARFLAPARPLAPVCKCVIEAKYGAVGCRRRCSGSDRGGGAGPPRAGGWPSRSEPREHRPLYPFGARPGLGGPGKAGAFPETGSGSGGGEREGRRGPEGTVLPGLGKGRGAAAMR